MIGSGILCSASSSRFVVFGVRCMTEHLTGVTLGDGVSDGFFVAGSTNFSGGVIGEYSFRSARVKTCPRLPYGTSPPRMEEINRRGGIVSWWLGLFFGDVRPSSGVGERCLLRSVCSFSERKNNKYKKRVLYIEIFNYIFNRTLFDIRNFRFNILF